MPRGRPKKDTQQTAVKSNNGANLGFEAKLFLAADKLRGNLEPSEYKHVVLGLIFLKYISDAFEAKREALLKDEFADPEDPEEYLAENVFWVPKEARWPHLQASAKLPAIGKLIDDAMLAIEASNASLKGVLPKDYARPALNKVMLGELIDLVSCIGMREEADRSKDILGRVYEYFLGGFAGAEGKRGGEFYTPRSVVGVLVEMLEPMPDPARGVRGRVYDPCCGSGGMFVQSERFVEAHGGRIGDIAIYGQESNYTTWRLAKMNLAVRGIDADIRWNNEGSFHKDELKDIKADFILANPPFNVSDWGGDRLREDVRWKYGAPPVGNANYAWLQHILHHLAPKGTAGVVLANGSMSSAQSGEGEMRRAMVEADVVDCMIACPASFSTRRKFRPACGSSPAARTPAKGGGIGAARCCSLTRARSENWWIAPARNLGEGIVEQIDGVVDLKGSLHFVEMKWYKAPVGRAEISEHLVRLISRAEARGIFISASDFTEPAIHVAREFLQHKIIIFVHLEEIVRVLESQDDLSEFLLKKTQAAQIHKNPYFKPLASGGARSA